MILKIFAAGSATALAAAALSFAGHPDATGPRVPVLVELFTSEGCSSCPPADEVLTELVATQPVAGAEIIALGEHVDYWDSLGWRDPFSQHAFSERQSRYASGVFTSDSIYTPQMVVNGRREFIGSSMPAARRAIAEAAAETRRVQVSIGAQTGDAGATAVHVDLHAEADQPLPEADVLIALVENGLTTRVERGENRGRTLHHSAVARALTPIGRTTAGAKVWTGDHRVPLEPSWERSHLRVVAFVQERRTLRILGAAAAGLP